MIGIGVFLAWRPDRPSSVEAVSGEVGKVAEGRPYYIFVRELEIAPKKPNGRAWDRVADEAPDPYYEIHWRDNRIFASPTQRDQLISQWSPLGLDTLKSIRDGRITLHSVINAASLRAVGGESFVLRVFDDDPVSEDDVAALTFAFKDLKEGENTFEFQQSDINSVTQLRLAVIHANAPLVAQIEQILNP